MEITPKINLDSLEFMKNIASDLITSVDLCRYKKDDVQTILVAKKRLLPGNNERHKDKLDKEIRILFGLDHENVVKVLGSVQSDTEFGFAMDYYKYGSYQNCFIETCYEKARSEEENTKLFPLKLRILKEISGAMEYLHTKRPKRILHLDLKPDNVLVDDNLHAVLTDFGLSEAETIRRLSRQTESRLSSKSTSSDRSSYRGTLFYVPPENFDQPDRKPDVKTDVYAFGILSWQILCDNDPYDDIVHKFADQLFIHHVKSNLRPNKDAVPACVPTSIFDLVAKQSWSKDPHERPAFGEIHDKLTVKISEMKNFEENLNNALKIAQDMLLSVAQEHDKMLARLENEKKPAPTQQISWEVARRAIQRRGGTSRIMYGEHEIIGSTVASFRGFKLVWNCECIDRKTGISAQEKGRQSSYGACEHAASKLIRLMINRGIYPRPIDEHLLKA